MDNEKLLIINALDIVLDNVNNEKCESDFIVKPEIYKFVSEMNYGKYTRIVNLLTNQVSKVKYEYTIYKYDISNNALNIENELLKKTPYHNKIEYVSESNEFMIRMLSNKELVKYIKKQPNERYIALPMVLKTESKTVYHQVCVIFDKEQNKLYYADPNGITTYFNISNKDDEDYDKEYYAKEELVEKILKNIGKSIGYEYITIDSWNPERIIINRSCRKTLIGGGHCVAATLILIQCVTYMNTSPENIYNFIYNFEEEEYVSLINDYTIGIYKMCK